MSTPTDGSFDALNLDAVLNTAVDQASGIISSVKNPSWDKLSPVKQFPGKISKNVIPIDFEEYRMQIVTKVEPGTLVDTHKHVESVFRYVLDGDLTINGLAHGPGDWVLVPGNTPYRVTTNGGYTVLASYGAKCGSPHDRVVK